MTISCEVLVVGAGPAGTSVAHALARDGREVILIDRARFPRPKPCAEYLSPEASRILAAMGALESVERSGAAALRGIMVRSPSGHEIKGTFDSALGFRAYRDRGLSVRREVLDAILFDSARAAGATTMEGTRVTDVLRDRTGRTVEGVQILAQGGERETIRARLIVGADGLRSTVARRLGLARRSRWPRRLALVTHFRGVTGLSDVAEMHVERDGFVGVADVGGGIATTALVVPASEARAISAGRDRYLERWIRLRSQLEPRFAGAERVSPVVATGPFASHASRSTADGALLVGDAADFFDPFTGQGIFSALRGGELAAAATEEYLRSGSRTGRTRALRGYEAARRETFGGKWAVERVIAGVVGSPFLIDRAARALSARRDLADLLTGVTGDFIPASEVISARYVLAAFGIVT